MAVDKLNTDAAAQGPSKAYRTYVLLILTLIYAFNFIDRQIIGIVSPYIQEDLGLSNTQLGLLKGIVFALFYSVVGIPIAWLADRYSRINIISSAVAVWSGFTALTGLATGFGSIAFARMGVGIGEAGGSPPSHSMISDLYPKEERAKALATWSLGVPLGLGFAYFVTALTLGANDTDFNWQRLLIGLGIAGVVLAVVAKLTIKEPVRGGQENVSADVALPSFKQSLSTLLTIRSWWAMCFGVTAASFAGYAVVTWQIDYLRPFDATLDKPIGMKNIFFILAGLNTVIYGIGVFTGGALTQKLAKRSVAYYGLVPAISLLITFPIVVAAYWSPTTAGNLLFTGGLLFFSGMYLGPSFSIAQTLAPINMRAMSTAIFFLILNLVALGLGPTSVGIISDFLKPEYGQVGSLRIAITIAACALLIAALFFYLASRSLPKDWDAAQKRNEGI